MIAKRIALRNQQMSSFARLVQYITGTQEKHERVGTIRVTNCQSEVPAWAALEAEAVQTNNTRTRMDKTYHLLISFREGDAPSEDTLRAVEDRICETLGYGEHQRVSAVHYDTDHMHIHLAINKIHPTRFTAHEPYYDKRALGALCIKLEQEYSIAADNHVPRMTQGEARAQDMEKASGIESLIGWIKRGVLSDLIICDSWAEMHALLAKNGLTMAERGNGLVIVDRNGIGAKASSVSRHLSKPALEKRMGAFTPATVTLTPERQYVPKAVASTIDTSALWALYERERREHKQRHAVMADRAKSRKERRINAALSAAKTKRALIKLTKGRSAKTILYHAVAKSLTKELEHIRQDYRQDRQAIYEKGRMGAWYDWLKVKATQGNAEALEVLRKRYARQAHGNAIAGEAPHASRQRINLTIDTVTKRGTVHYQLAKTVIRDEGNRLRLSDNLGEDVLTPTLHIAIQRFGPHLSIQGTEKFRAQVIDIATRANLKVTFADPVMEEQRKARTATQAPEAPADDAVARYVAERTAKREKGIALPPHRRYSAADAGTYAYAGMRHVEGKTLMLLQTPTEILVMPLDEKTAHRLRRMRVGMKVETKGIGMVRMRARRL